MDSNTMTYVDQLAAVLERTFIQAAKERLSFWKGFHSAVVDFGLGDSACRELPHDEVIDDNVSLEDGANAIGSYVVGSAPGDSGQPRIETDPFDDRIQHVIEPAFDKRDGKHRVLLDLDCPHVYIPSTTDGHGHLTIDVAQNWDQYKALLQMLGDMNILQYGYVDASFKRGETWLRAPGVKKGEAGNAL